MSLHYPFPLPVLPDPTLSSLSSIVTGLDQDQQEISLHIVEEQAWTIYLNKTEIVTVMTIGDYPNLLAVGYLLNQNLITDIQQITDIDIDDELQVVVVRTEDKQATLSLSRRIRTSGCAEGTMFEHVLANLPRHVLSADSRLETHTITQLLGQINTTPSLYLEAGAIHGCCLCKDNAIIAYIEDVGRHNAVDKIAGLMAYNAIKGQDCWFYTTGRLTTEMVIKTVQMGIPILISRSGFTAAGVKLAQQCGLTLIGRARGKRFQLLSQPQRIIHS